MTRPTAFARQRLAPAWFSHGIALPVFALFASSPSRADVVSPPPVQLRVYADQAATAPGASPHLLALLDVPDSWHIYWQNPGDSGQATRLEIHSELELKPSSPRWTAPEERLVLDGGVINLAYTHQAAALVQLQIPDSAQGVLNIGVEAHYLICREACVAGKASATLTLPIEERAHPSPRAALIADWDARMPGPLPEGTRWSWRGDELILQIPAAVSGTLFPSEELEAVMMAHSWREEDSTVVLDLALRSESPRPLLGSVLRVSYTDGTTVDHILDITAGTSP